MTKVSFIKRSKDDEVEVEEVVVFVEGVNLGFAELMEAVADRRPKGYQFFESWVCDQ